MHFFHWCCFFCCSVCLFWSLHLVFLFFFFLFLCWFVASGPLCFSSLILSSGATRTLVDKIKLEKHKGSNQKNKNTNRHKHTNSKSKDTQNRPKCTGSVPESPMKKRYYSWNCHKFYENTIFRDREFAIVSVQKVNVLMTHGQRLRIKKRKRKVWFWFGSQPKNKREIQGMSGAEPLGFFWGVIYENDNSLQQC